nr:MAG TPA: hypothetical protein [Caudoviricetes sp.]
MKSSSTCLLVKSHREPAPTHSTRTLRGERT